MLGVGICLLRDNDAEFIGLYSDTLSWSAQRTPSSGCPREMNVEKLQASEQRPTSKQRRVVSSGCRSGKWVITCLS